MRIGVVFGTRPEYLKLKPFLLALQSRSLPFRILHVGQHKDLTVEEQTLPTYRFLEMPPEAGVTRLTELASNLPRILEPAIQECTHVLVQGDTATAFFAALTAFHLKRPVIHLEAGLRTYDLENPFPEEAYRSMIARIASLHLCPDASSKQALLDEKVCSKIFVVGNTILDLVRHYDMKARIGSQVPITVHRRENWPHIPDLVREIVRLAHLRPDLSFLWISHPNPDLRTVVNETLTQTGHPPNLTCSEPCSHKQLCTYIAESYCVITDSGGIQEEASYLGKFSFVLRKVTERSAIPHSYLHLVASPEELVPQFLHQKIELLPPCTAYGDGHACEKILEILPNT